MVELMWEGKGKKTPKVSKNFVVENNSSSINTLVHGDCLSVMQDFTQLPNYEAIKKAGGIKLIYIDPPFFTGKDFKTKDGELAYSDKFDSLDTYLCFMHERLILMRDLLADDGSIYVHCDWRMTGYLRLILDEVFSPHFFINQIIWSYRSGGASKKSSLPKKYDSIFWYKKNNDFEVNTKLERQYLDKPFMDSKQDKEGRFYVDTILRDVFEGLIFSPCGNNDLKQFNTRPVLNLSSERTGYPTQKPEGLLSLLLELASNEGDLVCDFFCGSGTTLAVAEKLGRKWIGTDLGSLAMKVTKDRLCKADFNLLSLI